MEKSWDRNESLSAFIKVNTIKYAFYAYRHNNFVFKTRDWVCWHIGKERIQRRSKLYPRWEGLFQLLVRINNNTYKLAFHNKHNVNATFNVSNFSHFDVGIVYLRTNPLKRGGMMEAYQETQRSLT